VTLRGREERWQNLEKLQKINFQKFMKSLMIVFNQAHSQVIMEILDNCSVRGFTKWVDVQGRGTERGEPHYGSHAWPSKNMAIMAVVEEELLPKLIKELKNLNQLAEKQGLRVFSWDAESLV
jgi:nitrogen regulatory protein PII